MTAKRLSSLSLAVLAALSLSGCDNDDSTPAAAAAPTPFPNEMVVATDQSSLRLYSVSSSAVTQVGTVELPGIPGMYSRSGNTVTVTIPRHGIPDGQWATLDFAAGSGGTATDGTYKVTVLNEDTFTLTDSASGTITGGGVLRKPVAELAATYSQAGNTLTVTLPGHGLDSGDTVDLDFTTGTATDVNDYVDSVIDDDTFTVDLSASATTSGNVTVGVGTNYTTNDVRMHPSGKWLYVASGYDCYNGDPFCWGGDTITQYAIDWAKGTMTVVDIVRMEDTSYDMPVRMDINADGTRLVVQDDELDGMRLFGINATTGELSQLANSGSSTSSEHMVVFSPDGQHVYHGSSVFTVGTGPDSITRTVTGNGTAAGLIAGGTLFTLGTNSTLTAYDLTTQATPSLITALTGVITNRDVAANADGSLLVTSGFRGLKSYVFNGTALAAATPATGSAELQADGTATLDTSNRVMYRSVNMDSTGTLLVSAYFTNGSNAGAAQGGISPSGFVFATVSNDGALARIADLPVGKYARMARFIKKP